MSARPVFGAFCIFCGLFFSTWVAAVADRWGWQGAAGVLAGTLLVLLFLVVLNYDPEQVEIRREARRARAGVNGGGEL